MHLIFVFMAFFLSSFSLSLLNRRLPLKTRNISKLRMNMSSSSSKAVHVLVPVADGSEEIETSTIVDTLVRGGATVTVASVAPHLVVTCSRGLKLCADKSISDCKSHDWDMIVCPGGMYVIVFVCHP